MAHHEQAERSPLLQPTAWVTITAVAMVLLLAGCGGAPRTGSRPAHSPTGSPVSPAVARSPSPSDSPARYAACHPRNLAAQTVLAAPLGMDQTAFRVRLVNQGPACSLRGYPQDLTGETLTGQVHRLRLSPESADGEQALTSRRPAELATGDVAEFVLHTAYACEHPQGEPQPDETYRRLRFRLPDVRGQVSAEFFPTSDPKMNGMWLTRCSTAVSRFYAAVPRGSASTPAAAEPSTTRPARPNSTCATRPAWPDRNPISDMQFVGGVGWAVGAAGLLTSNDGGAHWLRLRAGGDDLVRVDFVDTDHGWLVGSSRLLATADGGDHWTRLPDARCSHIRMVHFVTATRGFAVAGGAAAVLVDDLPTSRGVLLRTSDAGRSWRRLPAPADVQSVCFQDTQTGWMGTPHGIYATTDGGHRWQQIVSAPGGSEEARPLVDVRCAGGGTAWALASGMGGASSQSPHLGWRLTTRDATALFAEQYFPHPAVAVTHQAPGSYPGPFSQIDANATAFFDNCPACGAGQVPWLIVTGTGSLVREATPAA